MDEKLDKDDVLMLEWVELKQPGDRRLDVKMGRNINTL
jgi:hypothetical protein